MNSVSGVRIKGGFWGQRQELNAQRAIYYQWQQLVQTGCIQNFRLAAGQPGGFREGFYFADSDAYKWLDAAACSLASQPDPRLEKLVEEFTSLLEAAMTPDGYIFTFNQVHFPGQRWTNLQVEHVLYCQGHLIEAAVSHYRATGSRRLLDLAIRCADLLVKEFWEAPPALTDGHEEIELALLSLAEVTGDLRYRELSARLIRRRGRTPFFGFLFIRQLVSMGLRLAKIAWQRRKYYQAHPERSPVRLPARNASHLPGWIGPRLLASMLSGKFVQQHRPVEDQQEPVGHAVRFVYFQAARARLARSGDAGPATQRLERIWERMVTRRMFVTGGLGALPLIEGFGRDDELDPRTAYAETCAALGAMFWNREMALLTGEPRYDALYEWQLYNASAAGMGADGTTYLYNNPLECQGEITRAGWYDVPCCPSNLSRTWANLANDVYAWQPGEIRVRQYISSSTEIPFPEPVRLDQTTQLPWHGNGKLVFHTQTPQNFRVCLRIPGWAGQVNMRVNGQSVNPRLSPIQEVPATACGFDPRLDKLAVIERTWREGDRLDYGFELPIRLLRQSERIPGCGGKVAVTRGPLVYCLESTDNPGGVLGLAIRSGSLVPRFDKDLFGGIQIIEGESSEGRRLRFIPYYAWANRGQSQMTVFVSAEPLSPDR